MRNLVFILGLAVALSGCARESAEKSSAPDIPAGTEVTVQKKDGVNVQGRLVEAKAQEVVLENSSGVKRSVPRSDIASIKAKTENAHESTDANDAKKEPAPAPPVPPTPPAAPQPDDKADAIKKPALPEYREVTIPAGTSLSLELKTAVASDTSKVEDQVRAALRSPVVVDGLQALPAGTAVLGHVTSAERSGKVKGRALVAFRFNTIDLPGDGGRESISTATVSHEAATTKKKDATKIGVGAGAGAALGAIIGGGSGAAKGAAIGGAAGTGAVLATRGDEVRLGPGAPVTTKLTAPLTVRVPLK
jgi:hypothetical protein